MSNLLLSIHLEGGESQMKKDDKARGIIGIWSLIVILIVVVSGIASGAIAQNLQKIDNTKQQPKNIEFVLYQLVQFEDRDDFAKTHGLYLKEEKVRIIIELNNSTEIPNGYNIEIETCYENLVQALVPIDNLIALSEEPDINFIRTSLPAYPQETSKSPGFTSTMAMLMLIAIFMLILFKKRGEINKRR